MRDGRTPRLPGARRVLVTSIERGSVFRPPAGPSRAAARKALRD